MKILCRRNGACASGRKNTNIRPHLFIIQEKMNGDFLVTIWINRHLCCWCSHRTKPSRETSAGKVTWWTLGAKGKRNYRRQHQCDALCRRLQLQTNDEQVEIFFFVLFTTTHFYNPSATTTKYQS